MSARFIGSLVTFPRFPVSGCAGIACSRYDGSSKNFLAVYRSSESRFPWCIDNGERNRSAAFLDDVRGKFSARVCSVAGHFETFLYRMLAALMSRKKVARLKTSKKKDERWESLRERE